MHWERQESQLGIAASVCGLCGHTGQVIAQSRRVRRGLDLLNLRWDPDVETYELCPVCGARRMLEHAAAA